MIKRIKIYLGFSFDLPSYKFVSSVGLFDFSLVSRNRAGDDKAPLTDSPASRALLALHSLAVDVFPSR